MGDAEDYWPAIENTEDPESPVVMLRKHAEKLSEKSARRLRGRVATSTGRLGPDALGALGKENLFDQDNFTHVFYIDLPLLDYSFQLFAVSHGIDYYPVIYYDDYHMVHPLANASEFDTWLKTFLSSEKTKRILKTLIQQAQRATQ